MYAGDLELLPRSGLDGKKVGKATRVCLNWCEENLIFPSVRLGHVIKLMTWARVLFLERAVSPKKA